MSENDWIVDYLIKNQINNLYTIDAVRLFKGDQIPLETYQLIMIGVDPITHIKRFEFFTLLEGGGSTFFGVHKVLWNGAEFYVPNLSTLKRNHFRFTDKLTFERCTFIILHDEKKLVRLKNVRHLVTLPLVDTEKDLTVKILPWKARVITPFLKWQKPTSKNGFEKQKKKCLDHLLSTYKRRYPNKYLMQLCLEIRHEFTKILDPLQILLEPEETFLQDEIEELLR